MKIIKEERNQKSENGSRLAPQGGWKMADGCNLVPRERIQSVRGTSSGRWQPSPVASRHPLPSDGRGASPQRGEGQVRRAEWWAALPAGEKHVLRMVADCLRQAKADPTMAIAAAKWETRLICFIKFRLVGQAAKSRRGLTMLNAKLANG